MKTILLKEATSKDMELARALIVDVVKGTKFESHTFVAGGWVRDKLLGVESKDIDIVTDIIGGGEELSILIGNKIGKTPIVHPNFGTAQLTLDGAEYNGHVFGKDTVVEFVTTRKESYRGTSRKPETEFGTLDDDVSRRDFSINSMLEDVVTGEILDLSGKGKSDLENKIIRSTGDPDIIFGEDPLRILRGIRFSLKYEMEIEPDTLRGIARNASKIANISGERISEELRKIFLLPNAGDGMRVLRDTKVLKNIDHRLDDAITEHVVRHLNKSKDLTISLAFFFRILWRDYGEVAVKEIMVKLKFTNNEIGAVSDMLDVLDECFAVWAVLDECFAVWAVDFDHPSVSSFVYKIVSRHSNLENLSFFISEFYPMIGYEILKMKDKGLTLPLSGNDIHTEFGVKGKMVGEMLRYGWEYLYSNPDATKGEIIDQIRNKFSKERL
jgi:tRNA nucleotidyltransferase/poly(A) polymerase